jgi:hypothetical protein
MARSVGTERIWSMEAVAWIKYRTNLPTDPRVVRIAGILRKPVHHVVGALLAFWALGDEHTTDGTLHGYTPEAVDDIIGVRGFSEALRSVNWMEVGPEYVKIPDFDRHNGESAKRRAQTALRASRLRNAQSVTECAHERTDVTQQALQSAHLEKEKEKSKKKDITPDAAAQHLPPASPGAGDDAPPESEKAKPPSVRWEPVAGWSGIDPGRLDRWATAYPACDITRQLAAMSAWLAANPARARKSNYERFITNWLAREQDKGGDMRSNGNGNARRGNLGGIGAADDRRAARAAREYDDPGLELTITAVGGDRKPHDPGGPSGAAPHDDAGW